MRSNIIVKTVFVLSFLLMGFVLGNCCSIVIPPVVLTGGKTATEKQIVGSERKIEKNAWLIASAKTSREQMESKWSSLSEEDKKVKEKLNFKLFKALRTIEFFKSKIKKYKKNYIIGENAKGELVELLPLAEAKVLPEKKFYKIFTPEIKKKYYTAKAKKKMIYLLTKINSARLDLYNSLVSALNPKLDPEQKKAEQALLKKRIRYDIIKELKLGNWYQKDSGGWFQKKAVE